MGFEGVNFYVVTVNSRPMKTGWGRFKWLLRGWGEAKPCACFPPAGRSEGRGKARGCRKAGPVPSSQPVWGTPGTARPLPGAGSRLRPGLRRAPWGSRGAIAARRRGLLGAGSVGVGSGAAARLPTQSAQKYR